jgi:hypothetical protein
MIEKAFRRISIGIVAAGRAASADLTGIVKALVSKSS